MMNFAKRRCFFCQKCRFFPLCVARAPNAVWQCTKPYYYSTTKT